MLRLGRTFETLRLQLQSFTPTAKLLVGALMIILVLALLLVAQFAGRAEMVPLGLNGTVSPEAKAQAVALLDQRSVPWEDRAGDIYVPVEQQYAVLAQLTERQLITPEQIDFDSLLTDDSPFTDRETKRTRYLVAKMNVVARMISELGGIERASVVIDQPPGPGGIGAARIEPSATVTVLTRGEPLTQTQADSIARIVSGAHAALKVGKVAVVDARTARSMPARSDDDVTSTRYLDLKREAEKLVKTKIEDLLEYIPGVRVEVNAQVDASEVVLRHTGFEEPKSTVAESKSRERSSTNQASAQEPGVRPNTGQEVTVAAGRVNQTTENEVAERMSNAFGQTETQERRAGGHSLKINAIISIPHSWFVNLYRHEQGDDTADPDTTALQTLVDQHTSRIRSEVEPLIDTETAQGAVAGTVVVSMFADFAATGVGMLGEGGGATAGGGLVGGFVSDSLVRTIGLSALAAVSLMLMFMMVRRASRQEELPSPSELVGIPPALAEPESDVVGEASESDSVLEGFEIDEHSMRRNQMLEQINKLATDEPEEAAALIRKWMKHDA